MLIRDADPYIILKIRIKIEKILILFAFNLETL